jgi:hypothetical protein
MSTVVPNASNRAYFLDKKSGNRIPVCFNPASLDYSISLNAQGGGGNAEQSTGSASAKLSMELLFDTTDTGNDVRTLTDPLQALVTAGTGTGSASGNASTAVAPAVSFCWGSFSFDGIIDSYRQAMDFFSGEGVPLRATVSLSLQQSKYVYAPLGSTKSADVSGNGAGSGLGLGGGLISIGGSASLVASLGGDPSAARLVASANGLESLRADAGASLSVGAGISAGMSDPVGFSLGASAGLSAGAGLSLGIGGGLGASAGLSVGGASLGASAGMGLTGSSGLSSFAGLGAPNSLSSSRYFDPEQALAASQPNLASAKAGFGLTGKAGASSSSGLKAEVRGGGLLFDP